MSTIDTALASALAGRIESLLSVGTGATTTQTGASALDTELPVAPGSNVTLPQTPQPSSRTVLSAVALTLDAIMRTGGDATPASIGVSPVWPVAPALDMTPLPLFDLEMDGSTAAAAGGVAGAGMAGGNTAQMAGGVAGGLGGIAPAMLSASQVPVAQLAAALERTVADTGLFYESHLADWLNGLRSPDSLTSELQNRLAPAAQQLPLDWSDGAAGVGAGQGGMGAGAPFASGDADAARAAGMSPGAAMPGAAGMRIDATGMPFATGTATLGASALHAALSTGLAQEGPSGNAAQSIAASIHPATVDIVRQQLDLLATGQLRWSGEAWPGAKLDWTVEEDDRQRPRGSSQDASAERPWHTRITLSLPSLGTVDAELTLTGTQLIARVQASPTSASRLAAQSENFCQRLADAGIALQGLTIREVGGGPPPAASAQAASAYARASAAAPQDPSRTGAWSTGHGTGPHTPPADDFFDWDMT